MKEQQSIFLKKNENKGGSWLCYQKLIQVDKLTIKADLQITN